MFFGANCDETSGAFADEWKRPRSPGHHLFLLTKKQGANFFGTRSMRPWCVNGSWQKLKESW